MMGGSTSNKKDSAGRRLGIKKFGAAEVLENEIVARQRGLQWHPGDNMRQGKDHTLHASEEVMKFYELMFLGYCRMEQRHVCPQEAHTHSHYSLRNPQQKIANASSIYVPPRALS